MAEQAARLVEAVARGLWRMFAVDCPEKWPEEQDESAFFLDLL